MTPQPVQQAATAAPTPPSYLPFNRKERFFTGTVLPGIIAGDDFAHLERFLSLCGVVDVLSQKASDRVCEVQFLTEYGFAESAWFDRTGMWSGWGARDTPDVVIAGNGWIVAVEAKLYARQGRDAIERQLAVQSDLLEYWVQTLGWAPERSKLVALLPAAYADELSMRSHRVVTWESVADAYRDVASPYWVGLLDVALRRYDELKSTVENNAQGRLTGQQIVTQHADGTLKFEWIGRQGGPGGKPFLGDLESGGWRTKEYQVRVDPIDGANWWPISQFLGTVEPPESSEPDTALDP